MFFENGAQSRVQASTSHQPALTTVNLHLKLAISETTTPYWALAWVCTTLGTCVGQSICEYFMESRSESSFYSLPSILSLFKILNTTPFLRVLLESLVERNLTAEGRKLKHFRVHSPVTKPWDINWLLALIYFPLNAFFFSLSNEPKFGSYIRYVSVFFFSFHSFTWVSAT